MRNSMRRLATAAILAAVTAASPKVHAQVDAANAYKDGKAAFEAGQFEKARDQFITASQTDPKNPEVFLWLGKSQYQLGHIDEAVTAWNSTLQLAPNEPYAAQMLKALRGQVGNVDGTLAVVVALVNDGFNEPAIITLNKLLNDKALTDVQRTRALTLKASAALELGNVGEAEGILQDLLIKYPDTVNADPIRLLQAKVRLRSTDHVADGLAILTKLATDHPNDDVGFSAAYELLSFELRDGVTADKADRLARWIAAHPDHRLSDRAREQLIDSDLKFSSQGIPPRADAALHPYDAAAIATAVGLFQHNRSPALITRVTDKIVAHLEQHYGGQHANAAAITGVESLLKAPLTREARFKTLDSLAVFQIEQAVREINKLAEANKLTGDALPASLDSAVATLKVIHAEYPTEAGWRTQANLAERLRAIGATTAAVSPLTDLKPAYAYAITLALPVVTNASDPGARETAIKTVEVVVNELTASGQSSGVGLALKTQTELLGAIPTDSPLWIDAANLQVRLLEARARFEFSENLRLGKLAANNVLSNTQLQLIDTLARIVGLSVRQAPAAIDRLRESLQPWLAAGYDAVAEDALTRLAASVPNPERQQVQLGIVALWIHKASSENQRLAAAGLAEPHQLNPSFAKSLQSLYEMQAGLANGDPYLDRIRREIDGIVAHYKQIQYFDIADAAIHEKPARANAQGDTYAEFQSAVLADEAARREIASLLKQYKAADKLTLTAATRTSIVAYEKFLTDHPADPLAVRAAEAIFAIASTFEGYSAFDVAEQIDREFQTFAAKNVLLSQSTPGDSSVAEKAAFAAVTVADVKARAAMTRSIAKSTQENKGTPVPPTQISDEFAAAIKAYKDFIKAAPNSPFVSQAVLRITAIALDYARLDAWDVADQIYAGLLTDQLATRDPERIEFCRGLTQIGKVMPEHAKEVLAALLSPQLHGSIDINGNGTLTRLDSLEKKFKSDKGLLDGPIHHADSVLLPTQDGEGSPFSPSTSPAAAGRALSGGGGGGGTGWREGLSVSGGLVTATATDQSKADDNALAAITRQESRRANEVAALRDRGSDAYALTSVSNQAAASKQQANPALPVLSDSELARQQAAFEKAYRIFQDIRVKYPQSATAEQARAEIMVEITYWRSIDQWQRAAAMGEQFLKDNPSDTQLPQLRLAIAVDHLTWASRKLDARTTSQEMLAEVSRRFSTARAELVKITHDFPEERALVEDAQWRIATSFLTQARTVDAFSATLARGQFVRAAKELRRIATEYSNHPQIGSIPQMLWDISMELHNRSYHEEALSVWNIIAIDYPTHPLAMQAEVMAAQTYQSVLGRPLRAAEVYLEINFARGGNDAAMQNAVFAIGADLKNQKRWIEALRVLENFVQSFPRHPQAGQALAMIGQIHQANDSWHDAIAAYRRVINEFPASGQWVQDAKWAIADCTINLSQWKEAVAAYEAYVASFPQDGKVTEANRRIGILKDLANYQKLVDEDGPKAYDAQFQVAAIVNAQLGNWRKAVEEYQKVATHWPKSHLAADALHSLGLLYLQNGEVDDARAALRAVAASYPDSPYACDSLFQVGKSYEDEANRLGTVTRAVTLEMNKDLAQKRAYITSNSSLNLARSQNNAKVQELRKGGQKEEADLQMATNGGNFAQLNDATITIAVDNANREQEDQTAGQLADRQDKINAALRKAVAVYAEAAKVPGGDKAGESLLHMAVIYNDRLGDSAQAMTTWLEIVRQFSGTAVAEEASWQIAQHYEHAGQYAEAVEAYKSFLRNYRRSPKAADAQFFIAENYEHLEQWISAMDQYTNYVQNFPEGSLILKAKEQISFIKTYRL